MKLSKPMKLGARGPEAKRLQQGINGTLGRRAFKWMKVPVDGVAGHLTFKHAAFAGWCLGLSRDQINAIHDGKITPHAFGILTHQIARSDALKKRDHQRRAHARKIRRLHKESVQGGPGLIPMDGHQVPKWIGEQVLLPARRSGEWKGGVLSGRRSPEESEAICEAMCGQPTCPGRCAGKSTNHACPPTFSCKEHEGAVDVTDAAGLQRWCRSHGNPLIGNGQVLPADTPHFSRTGN